MSRNLSYIFPAGNTTDICQVQTLAGVGPLTLNGNLVNPTTGIMSFIAHGYSRQVSLTSTNNLSGVTFTVKGIQNGVPISEPITGPNITTVYGVETYDVITSITTTGAAAAVSVGSGWMGFFPLIGINPWPTVINYDFTLSSLVLHNDADTAIFGAIENIVNNGKTYLANVSSNPAVITLAAMGANTPFTYSNLAATFSLLLVQIGTSAISLTYPMKLNFRQQ